MDAAPLPAGLTDEQLAAVIRGGVETLNRLVGEATKRGLSVDLDVVPFLSMRGIEKPLIKVAVSRPL